MNRHERRRAKSGKFKRAVVVDHGFAECRGDCGAACWICEGEAPTWPNPRKPGMIGHGFIRINNGSILVLCRSCFESEERDGWILCKHWGQNSIVIERGGVITDEQFEALREQPAELN
jgi:hypothetical protein